MDDEISMTAEERSKTNHELTLWEMEFMGAPGHPMAREPRWFRMMLRMQKRDRMRARASKFASTYAGLILCMAVIITVLIIWSV